MADAPPTPDAGPDAAPDAGPDAPAATGDAAPAADDGPVVRPDSKSAETRPADQPAAHAQDEAEVIYDGSVSLWMGWRSLAAGGAAAITGLVLLAYGLMQDPGTLRWILVSIGGAMLFAGAVMIPYVIITVRSLHYTITDKLIERQKGILMRRVDALDLARVKDVELTQNLLQRLLKIGTLEIYSSDKSDPMMRIEDLPQPRPVYEKLRNAVIRLSQKRGIISMDR